MQQELVELFFLRYCWLLGESRQFWNLYSMCGVILVFHFCNCECMHAPQFLLIVYRCRILYTSLYVQVKLCVYKVKLYNSWQILLSNASLMRHDVMVIYSYLSLFLNGMSCDLDLYHVNNLNWCIFREKSV